MTFQGIIPALLTPYNADGDPDLHALATLVDALIDAGVNGLFVAGSSGEWWLLSDDERRRVAEAAIQAADGRVPVMIHIGANATRDAVGLARHAAASGADAISALPPTGYPYPAAAIWDHFRAIADTTDLPLYLYHLPQIHGQQVTVDGFIEATQSIPTLAGVKFSAYQVDQLIKLTDRLGDSLNILSGGAEQLLSTWTAGAHGSICTWHNCLPALGKAIRDHAEAGELTAARRLQALMVSFGGASAGKAFAAAKSIVSRRVTPIGPPRKPVPTFVGEEESEYHTKIKQLGLERWLIG